MLTLNEALRTDRLEDFIAQAEAEGVEAADRDEFDRLVGICASVTFGPLPEGPFAPVLVGPWPPPSPEA